MLEGFDLMKSHLQSSWNILRFSACLPGGLQLADSVSHGQTVEVVGNASSTANARIPVINDAGNVLYVNGSSYVVGNPTTPILSTVSTVTTILAPGSGDTVPCVLSSNGTVTYVGTTALIQTNAAGKVTIAQGGSQAAGFGNPLIKYLVISPPPSVTGVFDYGVAPDDTIAFRAEVTTNNFAFGTIAVYAGNVTNLSLLMDSLHAPPGLPGYTVDNNGYFHASRNAHGLSLFIGRVYNDSIGDNGYGIWLHDPVNGIRLAHLASFGFGTPYPGNPTDRLSNVEFGINNWPAMDDDGRYAFFGQGFGSSGVFAGFENNLQPVATNGLGVPGVPGAYFTNFSGAGPIRMGTGGKMVFLGTIAGSGITFDVNDKVLVYGSNPGDLKILAQSGTQAPGMPAGAVWKPYFIDSSGLMENIFYPLNDQVVMFGNNRVAFVGQVTGPGIVGSPTSSANDSGIWVTDDHGNLTLLARRGSPLITATGAVTPTNYFALTGGSGRDGKPSGGNRVGQLAFANGVKTYRVTYAQPVPLLLNNPIFVGNQMQLGVTTANDGKTYRIHVSTDLSDTNSWGEVQIFVGDGLTKQYLVTPAGLQGFYRVVRD